MIGGVSRLAWIGLVLLFSGAAQAAPHKLTGTPRDCRVGGPLNARPATDSPSKYDFLDASVDPDENPIRAVDGTDLTVFTAGQSPLADDLFFAVVVEDSFGLKETYCRSERVPACKDTAMVGGIGGHYPLADATQGTDVPEAYELSWGCAKAEKELVLVRWRGRFLEGLAVDLADGKTQASVTWEDVDQDGAQEPVLVRAAADGKPLPSRVFKWDARKAKLVEDKKLGAAYDQAHPRT